MTLGRAAALATILAAAVLGFELRLTTRAQLAAGPRVRPLGSDDNYHMRRARFAVSHFPRTILFDPMMNFPRGGVPIWPPLYDLMLAAPARVLHGRAAPPERIERTAAWVPPVLAAFTIGLAGALGWGIFGPLGGALLALFVAVCPAHVMWTQYGHTDQHVAESLFGTLALVLFLRSRDPSDEGRAVSSARDAAAGLGLAAAVLTWQGAIYWGAIFALALVLEGIRTRRSAMRPILLVLALPAVLTAAATAFWLGEFRAPVTYISFGFFQPLFLGGLAAGSVLIDTLVRASRRQLDRRDFGLRTLFLLAAAAGLAPFAGPVVSGLTRGIGYVLGRTSEVGGSGGYVSYPRDWLKGIFEARPLLADGPRLAWKQLSAGFFLAPVAGALWAWRALRGERAGRNIALAIWAAVTLLLALSQRLNVYYAAPLAGAALIEAVFWIRRQVGGPGGSPVLKTAAGTAAAVLLALPMGWGLAEELRAVRVPGSDLFSTLDWMRRELPHPLDAYDPRLLRIPPPPPPRDAGAVLAPWSLGHLILYNVELPVVANNFGYGFLDSIRFFLAESEAEAVAMARARGVRWIVATDLVPRLNDYASYLGRPPLLAGPPGSLAPTGRYFDTMQSRLYDFDGAAAQVPGRVVPPLSHFRLRFRSQTGIQRGGTFVARWKVFELLPEK